jgi:hypothetical protein
MRSSSQLSTKALPGKMKSTVFFILSLLLILEKQAAVNAFHGEWGRVSWEKDASGRMSPKVTSVRAEVYSGRPSPHWEWSFCPPNPNLL